MNYAIGFTSIWRGTEKQVIRAASMHKRVLKYFPDIKQITLTLQETQLTLWGRGNLEDCYRYQPDGSLLVLIGSPLGDYSLQWIGKILEQNNGIRNFQLPYDGRVILLYITSDGNRWTMWNDWLGSIPVYHSYSQTWRVASTLEPVVVAVNGFTKDNICIPSIVLLMTHGHFLGQSTLYSGMEMVPQDSRIEWVEGDYKCQPLCTISATDCHWETGYNYLLYEMHEQARHAIREVLKTEPFWILPLSSGLDSRLIAAVAAEEKVNLETYTWGSATTNDGIYARHVARKLKFPWKRIDLGENYLEEHLEPWASIFGSSMRFHGMYQMSFFDKLRTEPAGKVISGFLGDSLDWAEADEDLFIHSIDERGYKVSSDGYLYWNLEEIRQLMKFPIDSAIDQIEEEIHSTVSQWNGAFFQKIMMLNLWERQRHFTNFQTMLADFYRGIATPYLNKNFARFCFSLPRQMVENRRLLIEMMLRYYADVMSVPGTYGKDPALLTGRYLLKRRGANKLPKQITRYLFPEFFSTKQDNSDVVSVARGGHKALWPIYETMTELSNWVDTKVISDLLLAGFQGDIRAIQKIQCLQALAYRIAEMD